MAKSSKVHTVHCPRRGTVALGVSTLQRPEMERDPIVIAAVRRRQAARVSRDFRPKAARVIKAALLCGGGQAVARSAARQHRQNGLQSGGWEGRKGGELRKREREGGEGEGEGESEGEGDGSESESESECASARARVKER